MTDEPRLAKIRIESDGYSYNTRVLVDGEGVLAVRSVTWRCSADSGWGIATIVVEGVAADITGAGLVVNGEGLPTPDLNTPEEVA